MLPNMPLQLLWFTVTQLEWSSSPLLPTLCTQRPTLCPPPVPPPPRQVTKFEKRLEDVGHKWDDIKKAQPQVKTDVEPIQGSEADRIKKDLEKFGGRVRSYKIDFHKRSFFTYSTGCDAAYPELDHVANDLINLGKARAQAAACVCVCVPMHTCSPIFAFTHSHAGAHTHTRSLTHSHAYI